MILFIHNYFEILSLTIAIILYNRLKSSFMVWFIPYLSFIVAGELFANNSEWSGTDNSYLYAVINSGSQYFFSFIFYRFVANPAIKKLILGCVVFYTLILVWFVMMSPSVMYMINATSGLVAIMACAYFYNIMLADDDEEDQTYVSGLWVASGLLIFYLGIILCFSLRNHIMQNKLSFDGLSLYRVIPRYLSIILYSCFSISFMVWKAPTK